MKRWPAESAPNGAPGHPARVAAAVFLALAAIAGGAGTLAGRWQASVAAVVVFSFAALVVSVAIRVQDSRWRRAADNWLLWGAEARPDSQLLFRRAQELVSPRSRKTLARSIHTLIREVNGQVVPGPVPLNRRGIRPLLVSLGDLELRLSDLSHPVSPRGMLLVERLLTEPGSPLYAPENTDRLGPMLIEAGMALDAAPADEGRDLVRPGAAPARPARPVHPGLLGGR